MTDTAFSLLRTELKDVFLSATPLTILQGIIKVGAFRDKFRGCCLILIFPSEPSKENVTLSQSTEPDPYWLWPEKSSCFCWKDNCKIEILRQVIRLQ